MKTLTLTFVLLLAAPVLACPNCKESVATPIDETRTSSAPGFNRAIAVMLGASAIGVCGVGGLFLLSKPRPTQYRRSPQP
ncbi:MAG: hypothetical protein AAGK78_07345 [Planctomycetota bacterium]